MNILAVIPARSNSSRFHDKPLALICGKPMIYWVWKHTCEVEEFKDVLIATDSKHIFDIATDFGAHVVMTSPDCETATARLCEVAESHDADLYVMVNGDEPLVRGRDIKKCLPSTGIDTTKDFFVTNLMTDFTNVTEVIDPTNLKVVTNKDGICLFISRSPIPFPKGSLDYAYQKFVGVGAFSRKALDFYRSTPRGIIERIEENDSFRFIENCKDCIYINAHCKTMSVDTPKDIIVVEELLTNQLDNE